VKMEANEVRDKLLEFFQGNHDALDLCAQLDFVFHLWDDLIDKDKARVDDEINLAFWLMFSTIPRNPFFIEAKEALMPLIDRIILQWHDANVLERSDDLHDAHLAYGLRAMRLQLWHHVAYLIGGYSWARKVGPEIQRLNQYTLDEFLSDKES
jgi:hypothetical protein